MPIPGAGYRFQSPLLWAPIGECPAGHPRDLRGPAGFCSAQLGGSGGQAYDTRGQTVTCGEQTFTVAYKVPTQDLDVGAIMRLQRGPKPPEPVPLTAGTALSLAWSP